MNKIFLRNILLTVLALALVIGGITAAVGNKKPDNTAMMRIDFTVAGAGEQLSDSAGELVDGIAAGSLSAGAVSGFVKKFIYSDAMVSTIMSVSYPLLYTVLENLNMLEFAHKMDLFPTGPELAEQIQGAYTCCDKDGTRKPLQEVLRSVGSDWSYMSSEIAAAGAGGASEGKALWNTIEWGVSDQDSFYSIMEDMSAGLRGVFEVCVQSKTRVIRINVIEYLLKTDAIPLEMDAATIFNASEKTGYELCLVKTFNMLGLMEGEYPTIEELVGYTALGDIWRAILEPIITAVGKAEREPVPQLMNMLVNFVHAIESGELVAGMRSLRMDGEFNVLARLAMGYENGLLHNLGDSLLATVEAMGIKLTGSFNDLLDSLLQMITKDQTADLPQMDTAKLMEYARPETLPNGNVHYVADAQGLSSYLLSYAISSDMLNALLKNTAYPGSSAAAIVEGAMANTREPLLQILNAILEMIL